MERIATRSARDFPLLFATPFAPNPPGRRTILPLPIGRDTPMHIENSTDYLLDEFETAQEITIKK